MISTMAINQAQRRVQAFQQRCGEYGEAALHLAYHAALPVALNAELLHLLRINFFLDPPEILPYTVEFEFLLSPLCREIDEGLYEIEPEIRDVLLAGLSQTYDAQRTRDIATLLWQYVDRHSPWSDQVELERAQQLTALNFLNSEKAQQWLATVETEVSQGWVAAREWHVAMRQELEALNQDKVADVVYPPYRPDYSYRHFESDAEYLYIHLLDLRKMERPEQIIERFRSLFVDGVSYVEPAVLETLHRLVQSRWADMEFSLILNRCCYILLNYWWIHTEFQQYAVELVHLLSVPPSTVSGVAATHRLRNLVKQFLQTEQYAEMQVRAKQLANEQSQAQSTYDLTEQETEIWTLLNQDYTYQETAGQLQISLNVVKSHVKNIYAKIRAIPPEERVPSREELIFEVNQMREKYGLTNREAEIWILLKQYHSYQEISEILQISLNTVKTHVKNVYAKRRKNVLAEGDVIFGG